MERSLPLHNFKISSYSSRRLAAIANLPVSCNNPATKAESECSTGTKSARISAMAATATECWLNRREDQPGAILLREKSFVTVIPREILRKRDIPRRVTAWLIFETVLR